MMRPATKPKRPGAAGRPGRAAKPKGGPPADGHAADAAIRVACLPDPVKVIKKAGYPTRTVQDRLEECGMQYTQVKTKHAIAISLHASPTSLRSPRRGGTAGARGAPCTPDARADPAL
jgi:hypothetical protein